MLLFPRPDVKREHKIYLKTSPWSEGISSSRISGIYHSTRSPHHIHYLHYQNIQASSAMISSNMCEILHTKVSYSAGEKILQEMRVFFVNPNLFCDCYGIRLRGGPSARGLRTPITKHSYFIVRRVSCRF